MRCSGLTICTISSCSMSAPSTSRLSRVPWALMRIVFGWSDRFLTTSALTFKTMSVTSSTTPGIVLISCWTPWILILVTALPSRLDSRMRRRLLPTVMPKPRSKGSMENLPYMSVRLDRSACTRFGSSRPRQRIRMRNPRGRKQSAFRSSANRRRARTCDPDIRNRNDIRSSRFRGQLAHAGEPLDLADSAPFFFLPTFVDGFSEQ